jgi:hypothetical protein
MQNPQNKHGILLHFALITEQLQNKPGFHKSLSTGDGGGGTTVVNHE